MAESPLKKKEIPPEDLKAKALNEIRTKTSNFRLKTEYDVDSQELPTTIPIKSLKSFMLRCAISSS